MLRRDITDFFYTLEMIWLIFHELNNIDDSKTLKT